MGPDNLTTCSQAEWKLNWEYVLSRHRLHFYYSQYAKITLRLYLKTCNIAWRVGISWGSVPTLPSTKVWNSEITLLGRQPFIPIVSSIFGDTKKLLVIFWSHGNCIEVKNSLFWWHLQIVYRWNDMMSGACLEIIQWGVVGGWESVKPGGPGAGAERWVCGV